MSQFERRGRLGAHVRDLPAGVSYDVIAGATTLGGTPALTYYAEEVDDGLRLDDLKRLDRAQLALIAAEVAATVQQNRDDDTRRNAHIAEMLAAGTYTGSSVGVASFYVGVEHDRGGIVSPTPEWVARIVNQCLQTGAPAHQTIAALTGLSEATAKRRVQDATRLGLLEKRGRGRPKKPPTPKESE